MILAYTQGSLWRLMKEGKDVFEIIKKLNIDGIEYSLGYDYVSRIPTKNQVQFLKNQKYVSMHAPFKLVRNSETEEQLLKDFKEIEKIYKNINAKCIVTHPHEMPPRKILSKLKMNFLTENMNKSKKKNRKNDKLSFEKILKENPDFNLCLDVAHAYTWSEKETERIIKKWKNRIKQVHFSFTKYCDPHRASNDLTKGFLKSIQPIKELNVPIVIEENVDFRNATEVKREISNIRKVLETLLT